MNKYPPYSVLMSVYCGEKPEWLRSSIDSIVNQTVAPSEIVLVKDGQLTPELERVVEECTNRIPYMKILALPQNRGLGLALQDGIKLCTCELIARMDTDDVVVPERCEKQLKKFIEEPNLDVVGCWECEFWETSVKNVFSCHKVPELDKDIKQLMRRRCALLHPTVIFKKKAVLKAGNYRHRPFLEDYDLFVRMVQSGAKCYNIQESLYYLRVNTDLFKRRGGFRYGLTQLKFRYRMLETGFSSVWDFLVCGIGHFFVCLMPNIMRCFIYKKLLR